MRLEAADGFGSYFLCTGKLMQFWFIPLAPGGSLVFDAFSSGCLAGVYCGFQFEITIHHGLEVRAAGT